MVARFKRENFDDCLQVDAERGGLTVHSSEIYLRKSSLEEARNDDERLRLLLEMTSTLYWEGDLERCRLSYVSDQACKILGYSIEQWHQFDFWISHIHPDDRDRVRAEVLKNSDTRDSFTFEYRMVANDGRAVWFSDRVNVVREDGRPKRPRGFLIDITERKRTEETLINLSGRIIDAQEEERKRIARELHDDLNQRMALLSIELAQLGQKAQKVRSFRALIHHLQTTAQEISAEIHRLSYQLHPSKLDHLGLAPAVESLCEELSGRRVTKIDFHQIGFPAHLSKNISLCLFRIAQESLRNCLKHSRAQRARVVLEKTDRHIRLSVADDGRGFNPDSGAMEQGLGFTSMRERLRLVGGTLRVYSQPSNGTKIEAVVPLTESTESDRWDFSPSANIERREF